MFFAFTGHGGNQGDTVGQLQCGFEAFGQALLQAFFHLEAVHHHINLVFFLFVEGGDVINVVYSPINP